MADEATGGLRSLPLALDPRGLSAWLGASLDALGAARSAIDSLNVFPIADGDTGTNMYLTMEACWEAAQSVGEQAPLDEATGVVSTAALLGARGNSGIIMAEALRGICDTISRGDSTLTLALIARALRAASDRARAAVAHPVEGTILTVAEAAAIAAEAELAACEAEADSSASGGEAGGELLPRLLRISEQMHLALTATTEQLAVLARAGVVDAGAQGLVLVYDSLLDALTGVHRRREPVKGRASTTTTVRTTPMRTSTDRDRDEAPSTGDFEVMFTCRAERATIDRVREILDAQGDSLVVSGGPDLWSVHVHVDDAGAAIEAVYAQVPAMNLRVTHLPSQASVVSPVRSVGRGVVAQAHGPGIRDLLTTEGVTVVEGRPDRRPSTGEILAAIQSADREEVIVLPSDGDTIPVAEVAAEQARGEGVRVTVIPTRSVVQTLAAWAVHDPEARFDDAVVMMADASRATRYGAITIATRDALTSAGHCRVGDVLGLVEGDIVEVGTDPAEVAQAVVQRLMSTGGELITTVTGSDIQPGLVDRLGTFVGREYPGVDLEVIDGGQPLWPMILGVE